MKARLGKAEGLTATAHKLARILYAVITRRVAYNEAESFKQTPATQARRISNLQNKPANSVSNFFPPPNSTSCYSGGASDLWELRVITVIASASDSWVSAFEQGGCCKMPFVDGAVILVGGKNAPCLAVVTLCCEPNVAGTFGGAAERCLKIRNVRVVPRNLVDACAHATNAAVG